MDSFKKVNTIFARNILNTHSVIENIDTKNSVIAALYLKLAEYSVIINDILNMFSTNDRTALMEKFTEKLYIEISLGLTNIAADPGKYPDYERTRLSLIAALRTLYVALTINTSLLNIEAQLITVTSQLTEANSKLGNPAELLQLIKQFNTRSALFPDATAQIRMATLRPEYREYIRLYGYDGSFDPAKLAVIKSQMGLL
jgi:CTP synthase (UTP-ammonia lyase)